MSLLLLDKQVQWNESQLWPFRPFQAVNREQMMLSVNFRAELDRISGTWFLYIFNFHPAWEVSLVICESCFSFNQENWYLMLGILVSDVQIFYWIWPRDLFGLKSVEVVGPAYCTENVFMFFFSEFRGFRDTVF